jgi:hypothetical protein
MGVDMRKLSSVIIAAFLYSSVIIGQSVKGKSVFGLKTGINLTTFRTGVDYSDVDPNLKAGLVFGCFAEIPVSSRFGIQPEFLYSQMGSNAVYSIYGDEIFRYNYFSVPLLIKLKVVKSFNVFAGPQADFLIRASQKDNDRTIIVSNDIKDFDFSITAGIDATSDNFIFGLRYIHGTQDVSVAPESYSFFNQGVQASIGYKFFKKNKKAK